MTNTGTALVCYCVSWMLFLTLWEGFPLKNIYFFTIVTYTTSKNVLYIIGVSSC